MKTRLVAVGVSLGGLAALNRFLKAVPSTFTAPIVVVQHRRQDSPEGPLLSLLQPSTKRKLAEPNDKDPIRPNYVYVAPGGYHLLIEGERFALSIDPPVRYARPSIDVLFESAAACFGADVIGIVMTGASDDGAQGALAIKNEGGRVFVQDPATAESPVAPKAAKAVLLPDLEGSLETLAAALR